VHTGPKADCRCASDGSASCGEGVEVLRVVALQEDAQVGISSNSASMLLDASRGTVTPTATVKFTGRSGAAVHAIVNIMGRVRTCSPAPVLPGYTRC
jgi:type IV fimbrial biogenesis protein FimT